MIGLNNKWIKVVGVNGKQYKNVASVTLEIYPQQQTAHIIIVDDSQSIIFPQSETIYVTIGFWKQNGFVPTDISLME